MYRPWKCAWWLQVCAGRVRVSAHFHHPTKISSCSAGAADGLHIRSARGPYLCVNAIVSRLGHPL